MTDSASETRVPWWVYFVLGQIVGAGALLFGMAVAHVV